MYTVDVCVFSEAGEALTHSQRRQLQKALRNVCRLAGARAIVRHEREEEGEVLAFTAQFAQALSREVEIMLWDALGAVAALAGCITTGLMQEADDGAEEEA